MRRLALKRVASVIPGQSPPNENVVDLGGEGLPFLQGNAEFGPINPSPRLECDAAPKRAIRHDILLSVRAPVGALNIADRDYGIGRGLAAIRPVPGFANPRFLWWALVAAIPVLQSVATGSTYDAVTADDVGDVPLPMPDLAAQQAIADYLDAETARIDALIVVKRRVIDIAAGRFWELFLNRVEQSPTTLAPLRRALIRITDGPFGSAFASDDYSRDGAAVVRLGNIGFAEYRATEQAYIPLDLFGQFLTHRVRPGDLLIAGLGDDRNHAGRACVAPDLGPAMVKGKCFCARIDRRRARPEFLALLLSSRLGRDALGLEARGSTRTMINLELVKDVLVRLPQVDVQSSIVDEVSAARAASSHLCALLEDQVNLLMERRKSLITTAVTGALDVRGVAVA